MSDASKVIARCMLHGKEVEAEAINPGDHYGKGWLIGHACGYSMIWFAVEASGPCDAIDEYIDSDVGQRLSVITDPEQLAEIYAGSEGENWNSPDGISFGGNAGQPYESTDLCIEGMERTEEPIPGLRYFGPDLPTDGILATKYPDWQENGPDALQPVWSSRLTTGGWTGRTKYGAIPDVDLDTAAFYNQAEEFGSGCGDWFATLEEFTFHGREAWILYGGTFGNDHSPGTMDNTWADIYTNKEAFDAAVAELEAMPEYTAEYLAECEDA